MNRATKRLLAKQQATADKTRTQYKRPAQATAAVRGRESLRTRIPRFLREVRTELKKVAWPTRGEVITYTSVVLVSVTFITILVFGLDFSFGKLILKVFTKK